MKRKTKPAANSTQAATKPKRGPTPASWKPGQSGNPKGAPRRGESWREVVKTVGNLTVAEALERWPWLATDVPDELKHQSATVLKEAVVARVFMRLIADPDAPLWNALMNRAEGNPEQPVERTWKAELSEWVRDGKVTLDQIKDRLSEELYAEFVVYLGAAVAGS